MPDAQSAAATECVAPGGSTPKDATASTLARTRLSAFWASMTNFTSEAVRFLSGRRFSASTCYAEVYAATAASNAALCAALRGGQPFFAMVSPSGASSGS